MPTEASRARGVKRKKRGGHVGTSVHRIPSALNKAIKKKRTNRTGSSNELQHNASKPPVKRKKKPPVGTSTPLTLSLPTSLTPCGNEASTIHGYIFNPSIPLIQQPMGFQRESQTGLHEDNLGFSQTTYDLTQGSQILLSQGSQFNLSQSNQPFTQMLQPYLLPYRAEPNATETGSNATLKQQ